MIKNIAKRMPKAVKASIALFIARLIEKGLVYITTPIFTRLMSTDDFGKVSIFNTWYSVFGIIAMFSLSAGVFNNGMSDYPDERDEFSFSLLGLSNLISFIFSVVIILLYPLIKTVVGLDFPLIILMCISFFVRPAYQFWYTRQRYELNYKNVLWVSVVITLLSPVVSIIAVYYTKGSKVNARVFGSEIPAIALFLLFYLYIGYRSKWVVNRKYWKAAFEFNLPLLPHYLSVYLLASSDKIMISNLIGDSATAYYTVAYSLSSIALGVWGAIDGSLIPYTYEKCKKNDFDAINKVTIPILSFFAVVCLGVILMGPEIVRILSTKEYMEAIYVIPPVIGGVFFQVQYSIYANIVYYYKKPKYVMVGSVTAVILNILLNYFFIPRFGYMAAGYTTIICYIIQALIDYIGMRIVIGKDIYNMKYINCMSAIVAGVSILCVFIYMQNVIIRYSIIILLLIVCTINRRKVKNYLDELKRK